MAILIASHSWTAAAELRVSADFVGGSAEVNRIDAEAGVIAISPTCRPGRGWPCWWYFEVNGAQPDQKLRLEVTASKIPFRAAERLPAKWALPDRPVISADNKTWQQLPAGEITPEKGTYEVIAPASRFWLAWGPPFLPSHAENLLAATAERLADSERFVLAETRDGRPVPGIRLGTPGAPQAIWVQARQHAWEAGGSWVARGFLDWASGDDPQAMDLRQHCEIYVIPIMDVDNVSLGAGGKEAVPRDHNRDWTIDAVYPEVAAAQRRIQQLADAGRLRLFIDLHNGSGGDKQPYYFGPFDFEAMPPARRRNYDRFLTTSIAHITKPLAVERNFRFATYVKTQEERSRMSKVRVDAIGGDQVVALTLETAWNTPHSTTDGYQKVGRELGQTIASYLADDQAP